MSSIVLSVTHIGESARIERDENHHPSFNYNCNRGQDNKDDRGVVKLMFITLDELLEVDTEGFPLHTMMMYHATVSFVEQEGGIAWVHSHVLQDFNIEIQTGRMYLH